MTTTDNTAAAWRDLTDQLTDSQIARLARQERDGRGDPAEVADSLLQTAREYAQHNLGDTVIFGQFRDPAGATFRWQG